MSYRNRILVLQESLKLLDKRIDDMDKGNLHFTQAIQQKVTLEREISRLQRLEFEESYERLNLDDDR
jgi:hypothetical protein